MITAYVLGLCAGGILGYLLCEVKKRYDDEC